MENQYTIDMLTPGSVSIITRQQVTVEGQVYIVGEPHRRAYVNSTDGRTRLAAELQEPYLSGVLAVWGDTPTVTEGAAE